MPQVKLVNDAEHYFCLLNCKSTNDPMSDRTNVVIAAFTTAQAQIKLYSVLEHLQMRSLHLDTDSVIFTIQPGEWVLPLGDFLGKLTNKLDDKEDIMNFVSGGSENYTYQTKKWSAMYVALP